MAWRRSVLSLALALWGVGFSVQASSGVTWTRGNPWGGVEIGTPGAGRPAWVPLTRTGTAVLELGDGRYWAIGGWDAQGRPSNRTWVYRAEPHERLLRPADRHPGGFWTEGPRMHFPRAFPAVEVLADGRILVAGGFGPKGVPLREAERIDPATGRCWRLPPMRSPRAAAVAIRLRNGRVLLLGGFRTPGRPTATLESYDPSLEEFLAHPWRLPDPAAYGAACRLMDGDVLFSGGWTGRRVSDQVVLFDDIGGPVNPRQGVLRHPLARGGLHRVGDLEAPRAGHRMRRMGEVVLIAGGSQAEPCEAFPEELPPEVWDTARPGPSTAFALVAPEDSRYPRQLPYPDRQGTRLVGARFPDCPDLTPTREGPDLPCWVFPPEARVPSDGRVPWDGRLPLEGRSLWGESDPDEHLLPEPRDRLMPFPASSKDPRPDSIPPGYPDLPRGKKGTSP